MDPDFMTRYLAEAGEREGGRGASEPVGEPDVGEAPSIGEPSADSDRALREDPTVVLPPDVMAQVRAQPPEPGPPPAQLGPPPQGAARPRLGDPGDVEVNKPHQPGESGADGRIIAGAPTKSVVDPEDTTTAVEGAGRSQSEPRADQQPGRQTWSPGDHRYVPPRRHEGGHHSAPSPVDRRAPAAGVSTGPQRAASDTGPQQRVAPDTGPARRGVQVWDQPAGMPASGWTPGAALASHLRPDELVKSRTVPPEMGWRKAVYVGTGRLVNLGAGPAERSLRDQVAAIASNIAGNYSIAVVSVRGGVGKTRTTAGVGTVYATYRTEPVIALDANPTYGSLGRIIDSSATASIREFMADERVNTYPKARGYTGKNRQGLEVLAGNQNVANPLGLSDQLFTDTLDRAQRFYQLSLIDCGNHMEHRVMRGVLGAVDALVIMATMNYDGAEAAEKTIDWLTVRNMHDLLGRSVLVLNDVNRCYNKAVVTKVRERLEPRVGAVKLIPFDKHLRDGAELEFAALRRRTQLAYIELAAWLAEGFATARAGVR